MDVQGGSFYPSDEGITGPLWSEFINWTQLFFFFFLGPEIITPHGAEALPGLINSPHGAHLEPHRGASPSLTHVGSTWTCWLGQQLTELSMSLYSSNRVLIPLISTLSLLDISTEIRTCNKGPSWTPTRDILLVPGNVFIELFMPPPLQQLWLQALCFQAVCLSDSRERVVSGVHKRLRLKL